MQIQVVGRKKYLYTCHKVYTLKVYFDFHFDKSWSQLFVCGFDFLSTISLTTWYIEFMIIHSWKSTLEGAGWSTRSGCLLLRDYGRRCGCDGEFLCILLRKILLHISVPPKNRCNRRHGKKLAAESLDDHFCCLHLDSLLVSQGGRLTILGISPQPAALTKGIDGAQIIPHLRHEPKG